MKLINKKYMHEQHRKLPKKNISTLSHIINIIIIAVTTIPTLSQVDYVGMNHQYNY